MRCCPGRWCTERATRVSRSRGLDDRFRRQSRRSRPAAPITHADRIRGCFGVPLHRSAGAGASDRHFACIRRVRSDPGRRGARPVRRQCRALWPLLAVALFSLAAFALGFWLLTVRIDRLHCVPAVGAILLGAGSAAAFVVDLRPDHVSPRSPFEYAVLITFGLGATGVAIGLPVWAMVTGLRLRIAARTSGNGPASARAFLLHGSDGPRTDVRVATAGFEATPTKPRIRVT